MSIHEENHEIEEVPRQRAIDLGPILPAPEEYLRAKAILQSMRSSAKQTGLEETMPNSEKNSESAEGQGGNLYEHLVHMVRILLEEQPKGALERFEELSWTVKRQLGSGPGGSAEAMGLPADALHARAPSVRWPNMDFEYCNIEKKLLTHPKHKWDETPDLTLPLEPFVGYENENKEILEKLPDFNSVTVFLENSGIGISKLESMLIWLSMRRLAEKMPNVIKITFWGKIFCTGRNPTPPSKHSPFGFRKSKILSTENGAESHLSTEDGDNKTSGLNGNPNELTPLSYFIVEVEADEEPEEGIPGPWDEWHLPALQPLSPDPNIAKIIDYALKAKKEGYGFGEFPPELEVATTVEHKNEDDVEEHSKASPRKRSVGSNAEGTDMQNATDESQKKADETEENPNPPEEKKTSLTETKKSCLPENPDKRILDPESVTFLARNFNISPAACLKALQNLPKNKWASRLPLPKEERSRGLNRYDYYVCTQLGDSAVWKRLPMVLPEHIQRSKDIRTLFTGNLNASVVNSPNHGVFPGVEAHLLRAVIARITCTSWVAPAGMYEIDEEAEVEEGEQPDTIVDTEDFEAPELADLLDSANWVHIRPHINKQGRCNWVSKARAKTHFKSALIEGDLTMEQAEEAIRLTAGDQWVRQQLQDAAIKAAVTEIDEESGEQPPEIGLDFGLNEEEMAEEDEDAEANDEEIPEESPSLLTPLDEDAALVPIGKVGLFDGRLGDPNMAATAAIKVAQQMYTGKAANAAIAAIQARVAQASNIKPLNAWRCGSSTNLFPENCAVAIVVNNRWPGAYSMAKANGIFNVYVGWGVKSLAASYTVPRPSNPMKEFFEQSMPVGSLIETTDPTPLEEQALLAEIEERKARRLAAIAAEDEEEGEEGEGNEGEEEEEDD